MHQRIFVSPPTFAVTTVTVATATFVWVIVPINSQISLCLFFASNFKKVKNYALRETDICPSLW